MAMDWGSLKVRRPLMLGKGGNLSKKTTTPGREGGRGWPKKKRVTGIKIHDQKRRSHRHARRNLASKGKGRVRQMKRGSFLCSKRGEL